MKKIYLFFLTLALVLGLCSCVNVPPPAPPVSQAPVVSEPTPPETNEPEITPPVAEPPAPFTAPDGTVASGVKLDGMTREEALYVLQQAAAEYTLELKVGQTELSVSGQSVELTVDETLFDAYWAALESGDPISHGAFALNSAALESFLSKSLEYSAKNPAVVYSKSQGNFVVISGTNGMDYDIPFIATWVAPAMGNLYASCSVDTAGQETFPSVTADDPRLTAAAEEANRYLTADLTYVFTYANGETASARLSADTIASFVRIAGDYTVSINRSAVETHASALGSSYGAAIHTGDFLTSAGTYVPLSVKYYGRQVDCSALTDDIYTCLTTGISGVREAAYLPDTQATLPYGGSYVEIDLTAQTLWVYKNGQRVVTTPIVSGCVANGNSTPTGVFSIYKKAEDAWLAGPTWYDHVDYWMPFYGAYGLHDADWRNEFGGEIYIHEGSHGCPNLPVEIAGQVYHNISVGTPVIIYGGVSEAMDLIQEFAGTTVYKLSALNQSFPLDITLKYPEAEVRYHSDNTSVATVSANGIVTVHGEGVANITVSAAPFSYHTGAQMTIQIKVSVPCPEDEHQYGEWEQILAPGCETVGNERRICTHCETAETQEVPATGHNFVDGSELCTNGCGTVNLDFAPDENDSADPEVDNLSDEVQS